MKEIKIEDMKLNPFTMIGKQWCLIGAKKEDKFNAMTASWGSMGVLWNKNIVTIYVRPQRYTNEFIEAQDYFTLNFFDSSYKKALSFYGSNSGRDVDKEKETGLSVNKENAFAYFKEANLVFVCKKLYCSKIDENGFIDSSIQSQYPQKDYHYVYVGEIEKVWKEQ